MQTMSIHFTEIENDEENLLYYDQVNLIILSAMKQLEMFNCKLVNITDYFSNNTSKLKEDISHMITFINSVAFPRKTVIMTTVELNPLYGFDVEIATGQKDMNCDNIDEKVKEIEECLLKDAEMIESLGFKRVENPVLEIPNTFTYIYTNELGNKLIEFLENVEIKDTEENGTEVQIE